MRKPSKSTVVAVGTVVVLVAIAATGSQGHMLWKGQRTPPRGAAVEERVRPLNTGESELIAKIRDAGLQASVEKVKVVQDGLKHPSQSVRMAAL